MLGAFTAPAAAVAWLARNRWHGRILAGAIVVVNVFMDATMIAESLDAERGMVDRVWEAMPGVVYPRCGAGRRVADTASRSPHFQ
jgi:hypothetical protein